MPPKHLPARSEDRVEMIKDPANENGSYTSADPTYIERLQDDIKISCKRLEEQGHESFLVTVSSKGQLVMGSEKGRKFLEEKMGLIEEFIYFCIGALPIKVEDVANEMDFDTTDQAHPRTEEQLGSQSNSDHLDAYDDDTDDHEDIQNDIDTIPNMVNSQIHENDIKTEKSDEKLKHTKISKTRIRSKGNASPETIMECRDEITETKGNKSVTAKGRSKLKKVEQKGRSKSSQLKKGEQKEFPCARCGHVFPIEAQLQEHNARNTGCQDQSELTKDEKHQMMLECSVSVTDKDSGEVKQRTIRELGDKSEPPFTCDVCSKSFNIIQGLKNHVGLHAQSKPFKCIVCCKACHSEDFLKFHLSVHKARPFYCAVCPKRFKTAKEAEEHATTHEQKQQHTSHQHSCKICDYVCDSQAKMKSHMQSHYGAKPDTWFCEFCGQNFQLKQNIESHRCIVDGSKPYVCDLEGCDKAFRTQYGLNEHKCWHKMSCSFICDICGKSFKVETTYAMHRARHGTQLECQYCDVKFKSRDPYKTHIANFHPDKIKEVEKLTKTKFHPCTECDRVLINKKNFEDHMNIHTGSTPHKCRHCDKGFRNRVNMHNHEKTHTGIKNLRCHLCCKKYGSQVALHAHLNRLHDYDIDNIDVEAMEKKMYGNPDPNKKRKQSGIDVTTNKTDETQKDCNKAFRTPYELQCQYCDVKFARCDPYKTHIANFHPDKINEVEKLTKTKFHPCTECGRVLINKKNFEDHMNIHTNSRPHKCRYCDKGFRSKTNMCAHEKTHTGPNKKRKQSGKDVSTNKTDEAQRTTKREGTSRGFQPQDTRTGQLEEQYGRMEYGGIQSHSTENSNQEATRVVEEQATALAAHMMLNFDRVPVSRGPKGLTSAQLLPIDHSMPSKRGPRENIFPLNFS